MNESPLKISMDMKLVVKPNMVLREEDDDYALLFDPESGAVRILNAPAAAIWNLLDGRRTLAQVMGALREQFESLDTNAEAQVLKLIQDLFQVGAVGTCQELAR